MATTSIALWILLASWGGAARHAGPAQAAPSAGAGATTAVETAAAARTFVVDVGARDPAVTPDGSTLAVSILGSIWTLPIEGGDATRVTEGTSWDTQPAFSPDGRFLAYAEGRGSGSALVVRNLATGWIRSLHEVPAGLGPIAWEADGRHIVFVNDRSQYDAHLWRIPVAGGEPEQVTFTQNWHEWSFALTPDGERIFLESGRYGGADLYEIGRDGIDVERLTETVEREMSVAMSPDGSRRAWVETHDGLDHVLVRTDGGEPRRIHTSAFDDKQLAFMPDGRSLVMAAGRRLYRLPADGGEASPIPFRAAFEVPEPPADLVLTDVRLWDGTGDQAVDGVTVVVRDGRVASVVTGEPAELPAGVPVVEGGGRTLLPGLMDNHRHYWSPFQGPDLLAEGVTSIRDPGVAIADGMDFKDANRLGLRPGPAIYSAGPLIDGPGGYHPAVDISIEDPAAAPALVRALAEQGVDALKAYFLLEPDVLAAVVEEAHRLGLPVTGHVGVRTGWGEAMDAGIDGFSHIRVWRDFLPPELQPDGRDESLDSSRNPLARMQADWELIDLESERVRALIRRLAETGTAIDPTIYIQRIPDEGRSGLSLEEFAVARRSFEKMKTFVRMAVEAGVPLLAGTDNVSLFDELETYAEAGVPNAEILRAATVNGARWLGLEDDFGTVEEGKRAHLVLVDGDPLEDVSELREIDLVVKDGVVVFHRGSDGEGEEDEEDEKR